MKKGKQQLILLVALLLVFGSLPITPILASQDEETLLSKLSRSDLFTSGYSDISSSFIDLRWPWNTYLITINNSADREFATVGDVITYTLEVSTHARVQRDWGARSALQTTPIEQTTGIGWYLIDRWDIDLVEFVEGSLLVNGVAPRVLDLLDPLSLGWELRRAGPRGIMGFLIDFMHSGGILSPEERVYRDYWFDAIYQDWAYYNIPAEYHDSLFSRDFISKAYWFLVEEGEITWVDYENASKAITVEWLLSVLPPEYLDEVIDWLETDPHHHQIWDLVRNLYSEGVISAEDAEVYYFLYPIAIGNWIFSVTPDHLLDEVTELRDQWWCLYTLLGYLSVVRGIDLWGEYYDFHFSLKLEYFNWLLSRMTPEIEASINEQLHWQGTTFQDLMDMLNEPLPSAIFAYYCSTCGTEYIIESFHCDGDLIPMAFIVINELSELRETVEVEFQVRVLPSALNDDGTNNGPIVNTASASPGYFQFQSNTVEIEVVQRQLTLGELIAEAEARIQTNYTPLSWAMMQATLNSARTVYNNPTSSEARINDAIRLLNEALEALVPR